MLTLIAAKAKNGVIGVNNSLPWSLPEDMKHFKEVTMGKPVVMGRKTFDSIGRPLPDRLNVVITRQQGWKAEGVVVVHSLEEALESLKNATEICLIGGAELYRQAMPLAGKLIITEIHHEYPGDALFPNIDSEEWREISRVDYNSAVQMLSYSFVTYSRRNEKKS